MFAHSISGGNTTQHKLSYFHLLSPCSLDHTILQLKVRVKIAHREGDENIPNMNNGEKRKKIKGKSKWSHFDTWSNSLITVPVTELGHSSQIAGLKLKPA